MFCFNEYFYLMLLSVEKKKNNGAARPVWFEKLFQVEIILRS